MALLAQSVEAGADDAEVFCAVASVKATRDFLFHLRHAYGAFRHMIRERHRGSAEETQYGIGFVPCH